MSATSWRVVGIASEPRVTSTRKLIPTQQESTVHFSQLMFQVEHREDALHAKPRPTAQKEIWSGCDRTHNCGLSSIRLSAGMSSLPKVATSEGEGSYFPKNSCRTRSSCWMLPRASSFHSSSSPSEAIQASWLLTENDHFRPAPPG